MDIKFPFSGPMPPQFEEVRAYFSDRAVSVREAEDFFLLNEKRHWCGRNGNLLKSWKPLAQRWIAGIGRKSLPNTDKSSAPTSSAQARGRKSGPWITRLLSTGHSRRLLKVDPNFTMPPPTSSYEQQLRDAGLKQATWVIPCLDEPHRTILEGEVNNIPLPNGQIGAVILYIETTKAISQSHRSLELIGTYLFVHKDRDDGPDIDILAEETYLPLIEGLPRVDQIIADLVSICQVRQVGEECRGTEDE